MKRWLPWVVTGIFAVWLAAELRIARPKTPFDVHGFGQLPVVLNGRIQPMDSVAINSLLSMRGKRTVGQDEGKGARTRKITATEWLLEVMMRPQEAAKYKSFRIQHPDLQGLLERPEGLAYFSFNELEPHLEKLQQQAGPIKEALESRQKDSKQLTPYERDLMHLYDSLVLYQRLKNSLRPEHDFDHPELLDGKAGDFAAEVDLFVKVYRTALDKGMEAFRKRQAGEEYKEEELDLLGKLFARAKQYQLVASVAYPLAIPPLIPKTGRENWSNMGTNLLEGIRSGEMHPAVIAYAKMATAYRNGQAPEFNQAVGDYQKWLAQQGLMPELSKGHREFFFNQYEPFYKSTILYVIVLLVGCVFWLNWTDWVRRTGMSLLWLAFVVHTAGLIYRMFLEGRPPVTNLYSSAIFIGWGAVLLGLILEKIYPEGIGIVVAAAIGFTTQIIAHHLSLSGDTMQMLQAVLDTNFWLATHVVVITAGYSSMFIAGVLAIVYILRGMLTRTLKAATAKSLTRMVYGIVCFSTLFSFVGTILGGIWADQSWGRFWGWDPKENGALLIVLWCAIILHARWGGLIREQGLMAMAIFGNVITSFSWFGVNMLGVGLHSYGFMDEAFRWLMIFVVSQLVLIGMAMVPKKYWLSFRDAESGGDGPPLGDWKKRRPASASA